MLAASLAGNVLAADGAELVLADWRDPGGATHPPRYWNPRPEPARYLLVMTARIAALIDALHAPGETRGMDAVFRDYESTLIGWPNG